MLKQHLTHCGSFLINNVKINNSMNNKLAMTKFFTPLPSNTIKQV